MDPNQLKNSEKIKLEKKIKKLSNGYSFDCHWLYFS